MKVMEGLPHGCWGESSRKRLPGCLHPRVPEFIAEYKLSALQRDLLRRVGMANLADQFWQTLQSCLRSNHRTSLHHGGHNFVLQKSAYLHHLSLHN
jgi:hypothetical protein